MAKRSREVILEQWRELLRLRREVLKTSSSEAIHDLRVSSRRFRAALELFEPWLPQKNTALLKKSSRKLTRALGALRNIDEALLFFQRHPPDETVGGSQLSYTLTEMRCGELTRLKKALKNFDHHRFSRMVQKSAARLEKNQAGKGSKSPLTTCFAETGSMLFQKIDALLATATSPEQCQSRHALRIAIKKWRYFFEITAPILKRDYSSTLGLLKEYQTILGRMNDIAEFGAICSSLILSRSEHLVIETLLQTKDEQLLGELTELIKQQPLCDNPTEWGEEPQRETSK